MPFQLSPGVAVVEKDFSSIVPAVSSSAGAYCGPFAWGPVEDPVRVSSETDLVARFGVPNDENFQSFYTAANFLSYTNNLLVTRTDAAGLKNAVTVKSGSVLQSQITIVAGSGYIASDAPTVTFSAPEVENGTTATGTVTYTSQDIDNVTYLTITGISVTNGGTGYTSTPTITISAPASGVRATATISGFTAGGIKVKNISDYLDSYNAGGASVGMFAAKFPGVKGNGVRVVVLDAGNYASSPSDIRKLFAGAPGTSDFAAKRGITNDEIHIAVFDDDTGKFSGVGNSLLEKYSFVSKLVDSRRSDGSNSYYKSVLNSSSKYIWWMDHPYSASYSEPTSVNIVNNEIGASASFGSGGTIQINVAGTSDTLYPYLEAFRTFVTDAVDSTTRQIRVAGTSLNNGIYNVASVIKNANPSTGAVTSFTINVIGGLVTEIAAGTKLYSVNKAQWGQSSVEMASTEGNDTFKVLSAPVSVYLAGGTDDFASTDGDIVNAYAVLTNPEQYDISLLPVGNVSPSVANQIVSLFDGTNATYGGRRDCMVFLSPNIDGQPITSTGSTATDAIITYRNDTNINSSYAVIDSGWKYQYDRYNDQYRWVPLNGDVAGLCARTDYTADPWYSPGGFNRGQIKNIVKLGFNPSQTDRDVLYSAGVNPVVSFPGQGTILYGDKTMLAKPSAFDRINVRRLFIVLEKAIAIAAKFQMFEFNDGFTRAQFKNLVEPYLRDVQGRRGVTDFRVKCDEANNSGEVIDRNEFVADIFIKPNRSINFITLNFVAARTSVSFEEIGG